NRCELIGYDWQHASLWYRGDRCGLRRGLAIAAWCSPDATHRRMHGNNSASPHDWAWRRYGDCRQLCGGWGGRGVLGHRTTTQAAQHQPACTSPVEDSSFRLENHLSTSLIAIDDRWLDSKRLRRPATRGGDRPGSFMRSMSGSGRSARLERG